MLSLRELQLDFLARTLDAVNAKVVPPGLFRRRLDSGIGLEVYRNNARVGFQKALQSSYPVLLKLAGEDWFNAIAGKYQSRFPSRSGDLNDVGREFAEFLAAHLKSESDRYGHAYDYFPDIARLEWIFQEVLSLADVAVPDLADLQTRLVDFGAEGVLVANPTARLLRSRFPIHEIWSWNRSRTDTVPDLDRGGSWVLVMKSGAETRVLKLDADAATLLQALKLDRPFAALIEPLNIDLAKALAHLIQIHAIVGVSTLGGDFHVN